MTESAESVWRVPLVAVQPYLFRAEDFVSTEVYSLPDTYMLFNRAMIERQGERIEIISSIQADGSEGYELRHPVERAVSPDVGRSPFTPLYSLQAAQVLAVNPSDAELEGYGLAPASAKLTLEGAGEPKPVVFLAGKEEDGFVCLMREGVPVVYSLPATLVPWSKMEFWEYLGFYPLSVSINDISTVELSGKNRTYTLALIMEHEADNAFLREALLDGVPVSQEDARQFYAKIALIRTGELLGEPPQGEAEWVIRLYGELGEELRSLSVYSRDEELCAQIGAELYCFAIGREQVEELLLQCEALLETNPA